MWRRPARVSELRDVGNRVERCLEGGERGEGLGATEAEVEGEDARKALQ